MECPSIARFPTKMPKQNDEHLHSAREPKKQKRSMSPHVRYPAFRLSASVVYVAVPKRTFKAAMQLRKIAAYQLALARMDV
jgi:hypothetical protein